jgi:hypothetical protein
MRMTSTININFNLGIKIVVCFLIVLALVSFYSYVADLNLHLHSDLSALGDGATDSAEGFIEAAWYDLGSRYFALYIGTTNYSNLKYTCQSGVCEFSGGVVGFELTPRLSSPLPKRRVIQVEYVLDLRQRHTIASVMWDFNTTIHNPIGVFVPSRIPTTLQTVLQENESFLTDNPDFRLDMNWGKAYHWMWQVRFCTADNCVERIML